ELLARDYDLLLSIFPFEKDWYARNTPELKVEFVGNPLVESLKSKVQSPKSKVPADPPQILLLPGSRKSELQRHLPAMLPALKLIREKVPGTRAKMVLPNDELKQLAGGAAALPSDIKIQVGHLAEALAEADVAI